MAQQKSTHMNGYSYAEIINSFFDSWSDGKPDEIKSILN